ncbi:hypothetical protein BDP27DRAFT_1370227 [Rhodocollybia butyracea]|uniref:Uncharacterized protein n=1 Tax=Rhodocollybia butyracea TaxID=206335 RepID=A0A9P5TWX3_9AGAR|nr:hypothetical protein BDP27DRAFT_1372990 [Rhodocollybia butyracea]KAF9060798.1 hypothetical protein BDP27DRAFT_1370227 [Rhodocollybia butyracea]
MAALLLIKLGAYGTARRPVQASSPIKFVVDAHHSLSLSSTPGLGTIRFVADVRLVWASSLIKFLADAHHPQSPSSTPGLGVITFIGERTTKAYSTVIGIGSRASPFLHSFRLTLLFLSTVVGDK